MNSFEETKEKNWDAGVLRKKESRSDWGDSNPSKAQKLWKTQKLLKAAEGKPTQTGKTPTPANRKNKRKTQRGKPRKPKKVLPQQTAKIIKRRKKEARILGFFRTV